MLEYKEEKIFNVSSTNKKAHKYISFGIIKSLKK